MIALIQRVTQASVSILGERVAQIDVGMLALIGVEANDAVTNAARLVDRIVRYRIFADDAGRMNRSLADVNGGLLLVPQFTLVADTNKGTRPGFSRGAPAQRGEQLFNAVSDYAARSLPNVQLGRFGADMQVALVNDGPVTFWLQV